MPRGSRHKSHKQSKHSSREDYDRERSDSGEDAKMKERNVRDESAARVSRDSYSGEKRKLVSQSRDGKDPSGHGNGDDVSEEHGSSKRHRDRADVAGSDRWNGGRGDEHSDKETKGDSRLDSKLKGSVVDLKSKPGRKHDSEKKEENLNEKEGSKSSKADSKRKFEKDFPAHQHKDSKDKERGSDRDKKHNMERGLDGEVKRRQGSELLDFGEAQGAKRQENTEWPLQSELRNLELEKELEKRIKRRLDGSNERDKYQDDSREGDERRLSSRSEHTKDGKYREERHKDRSHRDKCREDIVRDNRHRDGKQREAVDREKRHRDDKYRDERISRDHRGDKSDTKHVRDEASTAEIRHKKLRSQNSNHDGSPVYDDRSTRCKDDREKRRFDDKEDQSDLRYQSTKEQYYDAEKKSSIGKLESESDRGRSHSRHTDLDSSLCHNRRRSSPSSSSHVAKDQYRHSKQAESRYRDMVSEERVRHNTISTREVVGVSGVPENASASHSMEKLVRKDDCHLGELSAERCPNSDTRVSPMKLVEKSPSSGIDRRHLNRAGLRRSIDLEDSGQRSGGSKDARDYSGNEGRGRELLLEAHSGDELSQADGDNLSVSSPFGRSHLPSKSKSHLPPPPPFRAGVDNVSVFGFSEEDSRGKSNNRNKRIGDSGLGRAPGNAWKGVHNWPSPVANGFLPFQHGPPPVGFHPVMQQFSGPSMFGVRPSIELNHSGIPYHIPDVNRFSSPSHPFGWRNPVDDSCRPPLHAWDANNGVVGDESHMYGRLDWDHNRTIMSSQGWETSVDAWKQNGVVTPELPHVSQKEDYSMPAPTDDVWPVPSGQLAQHEQNQPNLQAESIEIIQSTEVAKDTSETSEALSEKILTVSTISRNDDTPFWHVYLSKLDISADLTHPELYNQCTCLMDAKHKITTEDASQASTGEEEIERNRKITINSSSVSPFAAPNDSIFQRALSLYKKQREESRAIVYPQSLDGEKVSFSNVDSMECAPTSSPEKAKMPVPLPKQEKAEELNPSSNLGAADDADAVSDSFEVKEEVPVASHDPEVPLLAVEKADEPGSPNSSESKPNPSNEVMTSEVDPELHLIALTDAVENTLSTRGDPSPPVITEEHKKLVDTVCGALLFPDVSSEACEAVMPESIESGLVNLSRIHQSQSTH
ncbi:uncharacterized protein LOC131157026 [Malania oleifera]|uniref:uncharacterized protein LOC131157026 n=1 Tax=Malania oleifera TaxID=397392 RepID=UPI0025AE813F|nr:uncharacterized protein LOC131157026 [Malania oleifera]